MQIPLSRMHLSGNEQAYLAEALGGGHLHGDGPFTQRCSAFLERALQAPRVLLTTSCTHALEMATVLADLAPGDEVIVPAFTFPSTANAVVLRGARPVFADCRIDTLNVDENRIEQLITPRTKAIMVMHYGGIACNMDPIMAMTSDRGLLVIEDNALGLFGCYRGRCLGTFGALAAQSFHGSKLISCGEGGALIVNDPALIERAEIIREKGTDRSRFMRGEIERYTWVDVGSSYLPSDLLAAILLAQLEHEEESRNRRRRLWARYEEQLADWAESEGVRLPAVPTDCRPSWTMFWLVVPSAGYRRRLMAHLRDAGIGSAFHYLPLNVSPMGRRFGGSSGDCPIAEDVAERVLRIPFHAGLTDEEQAEVVESLRRFQGTESSPRRWIPAAGTTSTPAGQ